MRFLSFHCEYFRYFVTDKSRSPLLEELTDENKEGELNNVIVLLVSVEKQDEKNPNFLKDMMEEIEKIAQQLKVKNIVVQSFAHLFGELSSASFGLEALKDLELSLKNKSYQVLRPPFGWFSELEMKAKGHPLSRISRKIDK